MKELDVADPFAAALNLEQYTVPTVKRYVEHRGYMYILVDSAYPDVFKIGRSCCLKKRLATYNSDKPYKTARFTKISRMFIDCHEVEKSILNYMYNFTEPTTFSKEWFAIKHLKKAIDIICSAEQECT